MVPIAGPLIGGLVGAGLYDWGIRRFLRSEEQRTNNQARPLTNVSS
jgi:hypothetical protein